MTETASPTTKAAKKGAGMSIARVFSTDGVHRKPVVVTDANGDEAIVIHSVGVLALAWDHRAFDGAYVAAFLDRLREIIETRDWAAEL